MNPESRLMSQLEAMRGQPFTRREALRYSLAGTAGLMLADRFNLNALAAEELKQKPVLKGKAKSVIQVFLWGGMSIPTPGIQNRMPAMTIRASSQQLSLPM